MQQTLKKSPRIEVVDALRGFAIMAILLLHNVEHFIFSVYPENAPAWLAAIDKGVLNISFCIFGGKAYAIFAMLFGFTFHIQTYNQRMRGKDFGPRFLWRMVLLLAFATINAAFFPGGDVLLLFAIMSVVLFFTRNWSDRAILCAAIFFLLQPYEWFCYISNAIDPTFQIAKINVDAMYAEVAAATASGDFWHFVWTNVTTGQVASLCWAINAGRFEQTAGMFLLGFYIGRRQLFASTEANMDMWTKVLIVAAVTFAPLHSLMQLTMEGSQYVQQTVGTAFDMWQKLAFTMVLVSSFVTLYRKEAVSKRLGGMRIYGKMSLTNYLSQSIIGALIYFPFGLYLAPYCGHTLSLLIGVLTCMAQIQVCKWWLSSHKQGVLENLWHKWTWLGADKSK